MVMSFVHIVVYLDGAVSSQMPAVLVRNLEHCHMEPTRVIQPNIQHDEHLALETIRIVIDEIVE